MIIKLNTAPSIEPVTIDQLKGHLLHDSSSYDELAEAAEDETLAELIVAARIEVESDTNRKLITQTWDYYPKYFPCEDRIKIPFGNLQSVASFSYKDSDGDETALSEDTHYIVETNGASCGYVVLPYGETWPSATLYPSNPITITFACGYGDTASDVPAPAKQAIKRACANSWANLGDDAVVNGTIMKDETYKRLINVVPRLYDMDFI